MVTHDVEAAVYLASRVYVLNSHPGRVAAEVPVPFGDDRSPELKRDALFLDVRDHVQRLLADEALIAA
jgi:NitT/TauT family transport system ATP-binding protein